MATSLPRAITAPAAIILAAAAVGCVVLSSLFAPTKTITPDGNHRHDALHVRSLRLVNNQERIRYYSDPKTVQARVPHEIDAALWWKDIDYAQPGLCGGVKCFFLSVSNPTIGYLIWDVNWGPEYDYSIAKKVYDYGIELESKYNIRQFSSSPPYEMETPEYFKEHLTGEYRERFSEVKHLVVQPSRTAPEGSIILRCYNENFKIKRLDRILKYMNQKVKKRLVGELEATIPLAKARPELQSDFQLLIDEKGRVYHLDFDRTLRGYPTKYTRNVFRNCLEDVVEHVKQSMN